MAAPRHGTSDQRLRRKIIIEDRFVVSSKGSALHSRAIQKWLLPVGPGLLLWQGPSRLCPTTRLYLQCSRSPVLLFHRQFPRSRSLLPNMVQLLRHWCGLRHASRISRLRFALRSVHSVRTLLPRMLADGYEACWINRLAPSCGQTRLTPTRLPICESRVLDVSRPASCRRLDTTARLRARGQIRSPHRRAMHTMTRQYRPPASPRLY